MHIQVLCDAFLHLLQQHHHLHLLGTSEIRKPTSLMSPPGTLTKLHTTPKGLLSPSKTYR